MREFNRTVGVLAMVCLVWAAGSARANLLTNGDFETGDLGGWTVRLTPNGHTFAQQVVAYDIDGPGPLGSSPAANFWVGQLNFMSGAWEGVEMVQDLALTGGTQYTFDADLSVFRNPTSPNNGSGGRFEVIVDGAVLATWDSGSIIQGVPEYSHLTATFTPAVSANHEVGLRITRPFFATDVQQYVDNVVFDSQSGGLLADMNCDGLVDGSDVAPLVLALLNPGQYAAAFPGCDINNGDTNGDGVVDPNDVPSFAQCLMNGGCP